MYDAALDPGCQLTGVDNVAASSGGDLVVAEDRGSMELVVLAPEGTASALLRVVGQDGSELAGPAFDLSGRHLYSACSAVVQSSSGSRTRVGESLLLLCNSPSGTRGARSGGHRECGLTASLIGITVFQYG